jgi:hypothetical protein
MSRLFYLSKIKLVDFRLRGSIWSSRWALPNLVRGAGDSGNGSEEMLIRKIGIVGVIDAKESVVMREGLLIRACLECV